MNVLVYDPEISARLIAEREATDIGKHDEVWDGVYVMSPLANFLHQILASRLSLPLHAVVGDSGLVLVGLNVSDREEGWVKNFREPDLAVILAGNPGNVCETHFCGGPDFVVEILSPNDPARQKREFYAKVGVRELQIVDRYPWALELYRLDDGLLKLVGRATEDDPVVLSSVVLPLSFRLIPGPDRPRIEVTRTDRTETWLI